MVIIFSYAASHSAANIACTCKALRDFTATPRFWEYAVRVALANRLAGRIHPLQLAQINVFAATPPEAMAYSLTMRQRVGWMFNTILSGVASLYRPPLPNFSQEYGAFAIWNMATGYGMRWTWSLTQLDNFALTFGGWEIGQRPVSYATTSSVAITLYSMHPTARRMIKHTGNDPIYEIYDPIGDRTWVGPARLMKSTPYSPAYFKPLENSQTGRWQKGK